MKFFYIFILYLIDKRKLANKEKNTENYIKPILNICVPIAITSYIRSGLSTLKQLIVPTRLEKSGLSCSEALSKYGLISGMVLPILLFPSVFINSFAGLLIPEFSSLFVTKNYKRINTLTSRIFKTTFMFSASTFVQVVSSGFPNTRSALTANLPLSGVNTLVSFTYRAFTGVGSSV